MRIISGTLKGRRFTVPGNIPTRPTTDFAKTGLFNILDNRIDYTETNVLDLFHGTGSISLECVSRGCPQVTAVDSNFLCHNFLKKTAAELKLPLNAYKSEVLKYTGHCSDTFDLVFADPPYDWPGYDTLLKLIFDRNIVAADGLCIIEHDTRHNYSNHPFFIEVRRYGMVHFSFFSPDTAIIQ